MFLNKLKEKIPPIIIILFLSIFGFIIGVVTMVFGYENRWINDGLLGQEFIYKIEDLNIDKRALFFLCLEKRLRMVGILYLLSFSSVNVFINIVFFLICGIYVGSVMEIFVIRYGIQGMLMYFSLVLPHAFFYILGYFSLGCLCLNMENTQGSIRNKKRDKLRNINKKRIICILILILIGIILESFVNTKIFLCLI